MIGKGVVCLPLIQKLFARGRRGVEDSTNVNERGGGVCSHNKSSLQHEKASRVDNPFPEAWNDNEALFC